MLVDGKTIAEEIKQEVRAIASTLLRSPKLVALQVGEDPATESFLKIKRQLGQESGVTVYVEKFPEHISSEALAIHIQHFAARPETTGLIVQLPLPPHIRGEEILNWIPVEKDPDLLSERARELFNTGKSVILPPVVAAVEEIFARYNVDLADKHIVVVGEGMLVGKPIVTWLRGEGHNPVVLTRESLDSFEVFRNADIIISGAGSPGLITPEKIKEGVILIDAGTSSPREGQGEQLGKMSGDADPRCANKARLFTPVPGGVGPIAVGMLFKNLVTLALKH